MRFRVILLIIILSFQFNLIFSQEDHTPVHEHIYEVGLAIGPVLLINETDFAASIHLHALRNLGQEQRFAVGIGLEGILDEHKHSAVSAILLYRPFDEFSLSIGPGLTMEGQSEKNFHAGIHIEMAYEFDVSFFHLGPVLEYAWQKNDQHLMMGIHVGIGF